MKIYKIYKAAVYYSKLNKKLCRVTGIDDAGGIAYLKHHDQKLAFGAVRFNDLRRVSIESVKAYLGRDKAKKEKGDISKAI